MYQSPSIQCIGINAVVPDKEIHIENELNQYSWNENQLKKIQKNIGIKTRRIVNSETTTLDLMEFAAKNLIDGLNFNKDDVDGLIVVTQTPDYNQPNNSSILQHRLNLKKNLYNIDIVHGCSGFLYGYVQANYLINTFGMKSVLLLCGDTISKLVNKTDQSVAPLFGDASSCALFTKGSSKNKSYFSFGCDGSGFENLIVKDGGFRNMPNESRSRFLQMNGNKVMVFSITEEPRDILKLIQYSKVEKSEIDFFLLHQANEYILKNISKRIDVPLSKVPHKSFSLYGNTSSASVPLAICHDLNKVLINMNAKVLMSGFGVGLSWSSCITNLNLNYCPKPIVYK